MLSLPLLVLSSLFVLFSHSHPQGGPPEGLTVIEHGGNTVTFNSSDFEVLLQGNRGFRTANAALLKDLAANGQHPPFLFLGCSDSRVSEGTVFNAKPGTLFTERNIANQYSGLDLNARAIIGYGVEELKVKHIVVMGHYGCGGVAASIATPPQLPWHEAISAIQGWILPIRALYQTSSRAEIVALRKSNQGKVQVAAPGLHDPGFRALVEENVKSTVTKLAQDRIVTEGFRSNQIFFIHGWVYDIENGVVKDLNVSVGPAGHAIPSAPFT